MQEEFSIQVIGKAFLLRPETPPEGIPRPHSPDDPEGGALREPLRTAAQEAGLSSMRRPPITSSSMLALQATEYAKEQGKFTQFHKACYRAYWEEQQDLGKLDVLESLARASDLDWPDLKGRLESGHYRESVMRQYQQALTLGIEAIPTFLIGPVPLQGAAPYETFREIAQYATSRRSATPTP